MGTLSSETRREIVNATKARYKQGSKGEKSRILHEFVMLSGFHREHAIRLLNAARRQRTRSVNSNRRIYDEAVKEALILVWEAADRICGKRLKAAIPSLVYSMEKFGHLKLATQIRGKLLSMSAATIDRTLAPVREKATTRKKRRVARRALKEIPIKTFSDWEDSPPGFVEIDFVVHGGGSMAGEYLHSLVATDVCTGWTEAIPLLVREQGLVVEGLKQISKQLPIPLRGIDSDNDSTFINDTLASYCKQEGITFTRSRAYHKNDQPWIEQKNGAVIRKMVGHDRLSGIVAGQALAQLFLTVRLYVNFFQPSFKLKQRTRDGSKVRKSYHSPATPCERLLSHSAVEEQIKESLRRQRDELDPVELLHRIRQGQAALVALSTGDCSVGPNRESLDAFLARLPEMWRMGEARPTHRKAGTKIRDWRTRKDPFSDVWADILQWLQKDPDSTAKHLLARLNEKYPDRFSVGTLRSLQRRIHEWRQTMARKLVLGGMEDQNDIIVIFNPPTARAARRLATLASAPPEP